MRWMSSIEREVLASIVDDYESASTIVAQVSQAVDAQVSEAKVFSVLVSLVGRGLANAYEYEQAPANWKLVSSPEALDANKVWFLATVAGLTINS